MNIHTHLKEKLKMMIINKKIPHIIFHGPSGSGKRQLLEGFILDIYNNNKQQIKQYTMYVNCAHGKGIRFIRDQLKFFAKTNIQNDKGNFFKSIILFNADKLTTDAQSALRRCIERFSHTTRFFIIVEDKNKLLKPILSRFCNIYVAYPIIDGKKCNLHLMNTVKQKGKDKRYEWFKTQLRRPSNFSTINKCLHLSLKLYERGYNTFDIMKYIESDIELENKYLLLIYFDNIREQFRNEKLLMFNILFFVFMRPKFNLENIEIM